MNTALKHEDEVDLAILGLQKVSAIQHPTRWKNWDLWDFMTTITREFPGRETRIVDVGAASNPLLYNLATIGYRNLEGIDFDFPPGSFIRHEHVKYTRGDLTKTHLPPGSVDVVTSLSVIEHGVDPHTYFSEMSRILKPGGLLLTSTDYWPEKISTRFVPKRKTFGLPWKIHGLTEIAVVLDVARHWGFEQLGQQEFSTEERVVKWGGREYTFISFALRKVA